MHRLEDLEVVRVLALCGEISAVKPRCTMALLPPDRRDRALREAWRESLLAHKPALEELSKILNS